MHVFQTHSLAEFVSPYVLYQVLWSPHSASLVDVMPQASETSQLVGTKISSATLIPSAHQPSHHQCQSTNTSGHKPGLSLHSCDLPGSKSDSWQVPNRVLEESMVIGMVLIRSSKLLCVFNKSGLLSDLRIFPEM